MCVLVNWLSVGVKKSKSRVASNSSNQEIRQRKIIKMSRKKYGKRTGTLSLATNVTESVFFRLRKLLEFGNVFTVDRPIIAKALYDAIQ